ncbi:MAG: CHAT domain-containing protein, partial [Microlunatus sp.]|nr:CHAT domain-containing protein [Microlunatus sp.]
ALAADFEAEGLDLQARRARLIGAAALTGLGRIPDAGVQLDQVGPVTRTDPIALRLQQRVVTADWLLGSGERRRARGEVRRGLAELSRHQAQFGSIDLQTSSAIHGRRLVRLDLELAAAARRPQGVFDAIERGRAVSRRLTAVTAREDESAELLAELRHLGQTTKAIGDDPDQADAVAAMRARARALYRRLESISWRTAGAGEVHRPAGLAEVAGLAQAQGKVLVSYCQVRGRWSAVVLGRQRPELIQLPGDTRCIELSRRAQADLGVLAYDTLPTPLRNAVTTSLSRTLAQLDDALVRPLGLGDQPVVVVPTGPTSTLPWNCLPSLRGRPVEVSPTATSWLAGATADDLSGELSVAALAGPGVPTGSTEASSVSSTWEAVAAHVETSTGTAATRRQLARALAADTIVHVAAHGSHIRQNPLFSSLALHDGPLYAYEISPEQVAPHVVLSSCELGQATTRPGDEALGLTRVLLQLGAQCVVAGVAQVNDRQAAAVMTAYHRELAAGHDSAAALATATSTGPYAPFLCFGSSWSAH